MYSGIDYGLGVTNIDRTNGIRFGVIHANEVGQAWFDESEPEYGEPYCPYCGDQTLEVRPDSDDFLCTHCEKEVSCYDVGDTDPIAHTYDGDGYQARQGGDDCDIFITKSPYYTLCSFCSPCAPGAGYLLTPGSIRAYCFGHDWFENDKAPYQVYRVSDDALVRTDQNVAEG